MAVKKPSRKALPVCSVLPMVTCLQLCILYSFEIPFSHPSSHDLGQALTLLSLQPWFLTKFLHNGAAADLGTIL